MTYGSFKVSGLVNKVLQFLTTLKYFFNVLCHDTFYLINLRLQLWDVVTFFLGEFILKQQNKMFKKILNKDVLHATASLDLQTVH